LVACVLPAVAWPPSTAQDRARTQIFLAPFTEGPDKVTRVAFVMVSRVGVSVGKPVLKITSHQRDDDEPWFLADSTGFLFTSNRDGRQSDVFRYDIASKAVTQVTRTPEDEWGPVSSADGKTFTVARGQERRLWRFSMDGTDAGAVSSHPGPVIAHAWHSATAAAATVRRADGTYALQIVDSASGAAETIESGIGRSFFIRPDRSAIGFMRRVADGSMVIREWDAKTRKARETAFALEDSDDLTCTPEGRVLMGRRSKLFFLEPADDRWVEFADLDKSTATNITRLAVSPDGKWITIVSHATVK
jgi:sugar lactone lactonase YvrE